MNASTHKGHFYSMRWSNLKTLDITLVHYLNHCIIQWLPNLPTRVHRWEPHRQFVVELKNHTNTNTGFLYTTNSKQR